MQGKEFTVRGEIRRIDFEPKTFYGIRVYAHVFLHPQDAPPGEDVDFYTDNPRFEAALLSAFNGGRPIPVEVVYEENGEERVVTRVILDRDF